MTAIALRMVEVDFLKLRKKRSTVVWALFLALVPVLIFFLVNAIQHASDPSKHGPAGGVENFHTGLRLLGGLLFGPLVAILIGVEAGTNDASAGVFRELVVTGRSRLALFASRVPAALLLCWSIIIAGYALVLLGTFVFAGRHATPDGALIFNGLAFLLLATGVLCVVAVGFSSLVISKPGAIIALIAWQIVATPLVRASTRSAAAATSSCMPGAGTLQPHQAGWRQRHRGLACRGNRSGRDRPVARRVSRARRLAHAHDGRLTEPRGALAPS